MQNLSALLQEANQLFKTGDLDSAVQLYRQILTIDAHNITALTNLGTIYLVKENYTESSHLLKQVLTLNPDSLLANSNLGFIASESGKYIEAVSYFEAALQKEPNQAFLWYDLGDVLYHLQQYVKAFECYQKTIEIDPTHYESSLKVNLIGNNLSKFGDALCDSNQFSEAVECYLKAASLNPNTSFLKKIYRQLQLIYFYHLPDMEKSIQYGHSALALINDDFDETFLSQTLHTLILSFLKQGNLAKGIHLSLKVSRKYIYIHPDIPHWHGERLTGKRIIISLDGFLVSGFGDLIQFARYVLFVKKMGAHVTILVRKELIRLFATLDGVDEIIVSDDIANKDFDFQVSFTVLPLIFGTSLTTIPAKIPYLTVDTKLNFHWKNLIKNNVLSNSTLKVGLVWACESGKISSKIRTCDFNFLTPLKDISGITYYSLQMGEAAKLRFCSDNSAFKLIDLTEHINDFADTAALINNLDLVISVDTATAHLAGAIGKPVWLLLNFVSCWRWFLDRNDSPWYPTMRIFRAKNPDDWGGVIEEVCGQLHLVRQNELLLS